MFNPGLHYGKIQLSSTRGINGIVKSDFSIIRTIAGLALPVRCYIVDNTYVGSCSYADTCTTWLNAIGGFDPSNCPEVLVNAGIDCVCPFKVPAGNVNSVGSLNVTDLSQNKYISFFSTGDFDLKLTLNDQVGYLGCVNLKFTMKKAV